MPWHIETDHPQCAGYGVVKDDGNELVGCHRTREQALAHLAALNASENDDDEDDELEEMFDDDADPLNRAEGYAPTIAHQERATPNLDLARRILANENVPR